ncbi:MAG TPA: amino acid adenylation domain-containing protein, partial [Steroidobacteraceae bacterium]
LRVLVRAQASGLRFVVADLFRHQTIAQLAALIKGGRQELAAAQNVATFELLSPLERGQFTDRTDIEDAYPLSLLQEGMYFHSELTPDSAVYHDIFSCCIETDFLARHFEQAVQSLTQRHAILRTGFVTSCEHRLVQVVHRSVLVSVQVKDLSQLRSADQDRYIRDWIDQEKYQKFAWSEPPLLRIFIHLRGDGRFQCTLSFHHIILDGWSVATLQTELISHYAALMAGRAHVMAAPRASYRDFVGRERQALQSTPSREFWRGLLEGASLPLLPRSRGANESKGRQAAALRRDFAPELGQRLELCAQQLGVHLKLLLLAAHVKVMSVVCGQRDVVTGLVSHGRLEEQDSERVLGMHLNCLPLRIAIRGGTWRELILELRDLEGAMLPHRHYPLAAIHELLDTPQLFETVFNFIRFHVYRDLDQSVKVSATEGFEQTNFSLLVNFSQELNGAGISLALRFDPAVIDSAQAERLTGYYERALIAMADDIGRPHHEQNLLSEAERDELLVQFNPTTSSYPANRTIHGLFEEQVERTPGAVAVVCGEQSLTYVELNGRANQLAHHLIALGAGPEVVVGVLMRRSVEQVISVLAILKAGAAYLPLDPTHPVERVRYMLQDAGAQIVLVDGSGSISLLPDSLEVLDVRAEAARISANPVSSPRTNCVATNLAYVIYTSGSTGRAKGVGAIHRSLVNRLYAQERIARFEAGDVCCQKTAVGFVDAVFELFGALLCGCKLVIAGEAADRDAQGLLRLLRSQGVRHLVSVPSLARALIETGEAGSLAELRHWTLSGEQLSGELLRGLLKVLPWCQFANVYGCSEVGADATVQLCDKGVAGQESVRIGVPLANVQAYVLDEFFDPAPVGVVGEIYIAGEGLSRGYIGRAGLTAERFLPNPFGAAGGRLYRTGDRARYLEDGTIEYLGRNDQQVKLRGFRIELGEIESRLGQHAQVHSCVVVAREDEPGEKRLVAYYTRKVPSTQAAQEPLQEGVQGAPGVEQLREHLREQLPEYMIPSAFVRLEQLPLTANGKVDRRSLPAPGAEAYGPMEYEPPQGEIETALAQIWQELLKVERVGRADNFFALGGHSLLAVQVVSRVGQVLGRELSVRAVFEQSTIQALAAHLQAAAGWRLEPIGRADRVAQGSSGVPALPLSWSQERLWFIDQLEGGNAAYHIAGSVRLHGVLDKAALQRALDTIVERHEILRTTFRLEQGQAIQVIGSDSRFALRERDLRRAEDVAAAVAGEASEESRERFDLTTGPLIRGRLLQLADDEHVLLVTMHHIVSDGWSIGILLRELSRLYAAYREGGANPLAPLPIQYADYAQWQRRWLQGEVLQGQVAYWQKHLAGAPELLQLPADRERPLVQGHGGGNVRIRLGAALSRRLKEVSQQQGTTLFMTLYAGFAVLLSKLSAQQDLVIGTAVANRQHTEVEGLIGFFVNTLALRTQVSEEIRVSELLSQVRETTLGAYAHQATPFEQVVDVLQPRRSLSHSPLFQVMFVLQNAPQGELRLPGLRLSPEVS